ncbi:hypothetical protein HDU86_005187 [Geranomyces michiganensis]|nr:hypothetical protein HDU86_005187 [Geranomyces michiganensis]
MNLPKKVPLPGRWKTAARDHLTAIVGTEKADSHSAPAPQLIQLETGGQMNLPEKVPLPGRWKTTARDRLTAIVGTEKADSHSAPAPSLFNWKLPATTSR